MELTKELDIGSHINFTLSFKRLDISGTAFNSRYIQYGGQKKAGAVLTVSNKNILANIQLPNWKNTICNDSNVLKVRKDNSKNTYTDNFEELKSRLVDCFDSYIDSIKLTRSSLVKNIINEDIWYETCIYTLPRTDYAIYTVGSVSKELKDKLNGYQTVIVKKREYDLELRPVTVFAELDTDSGMYIAKNDSDIQYNNDYRYIPVEGSNGSRYVTFLDMLSTFSI